MRKPNLLEDEGKERGNKWVVYCVVAVGVMIGAGIFVGLYIVSEPITDYSNYGDIPKSVFYEGQKFNQNTTVYFVGSSVIGTAVYAPLVDELLKKEGYDNIETFNLQNGGDTPRFRVFEIDKIIDSNPSLVIYGITPNSVTGAHLYTHLIKSGEAYTYLNSTFSSFYTDEEICKIATNIFPRRGLLVNSLPYYLQSIISGSSAYNRAYDIVKEGYSPSLLEDLNNTKRDLKSIINTADSYYSKLDLILQDDITIKNMDALKYNIQTLKSAGISVIVIDMPIHPICYESIPEKARDSWHQYLDELDVQWIDLSNSLDDSDIYDQFHKSWTGCQHFSKIMSDLIIQEVNRNAIHNS